MLSMGSYVRTAQKYIDMLIKFLERNPMVILTNLYVLIVKE